MPLLPKLNQNAQHTTFREPEEIYLLGLGKEKAVFLFIIQAHSPPTLCRAAPKLWVVKCVNESMWHICAWTEAPWSPEVTARAAAGRLGRGGRWKVDGCSLLSLEERKKRSEECKWHTLLWVQFVWMNIEWLLSAIRWGGGGERTIISACPI